MMCQPTVDPKVKLCVRVTKKTDKSVPRGRKTSESLQKFRTKRETHAKETSNSSICTTETDIERSLLLAVLCFFCSPPLDLCSSFVTPPNESAAFHRGRRRRRHSRRRALLSHYLITAAASKEESTFGCVTFGGTRDIHGGAGVFDRGSCLSSANGKVAAGEPERRAG